MSGRQPEPATRCGAGEFHSRLRELRSQLGLRVIGQEQTLHELLIAFIAGGHVLVVGVPGLAKTLMIRSLAELLGLRFSRIQFTPDLMPSDVTGATIIARDEATGARCLEFRKGPIFTNLLLADEINRTPPKTQAALLEAMEEYQVTVGGTGHAMDRPFFVLATQNPIEQEGTYPLPITQLDRFLFQIDMDYPGEETELEVLTRTTAAPERTLAAALGRSQIAELLEMPRQVRVPQDFVERATRLVRATRLDEGRPRAGQEPVASGEGSPTTREWLTWGAGPRAVQAIIVAARASAAIAGRDIVSDADYEIVVTPALRHRILLNYHAEAERMTPDVVIARLREEIGDAPPTPPPPQRRRSGRLARLLRVIGDPSPPLRGRP